jgi:hypothetical protein
MIILTIVQDLNNSKWLTELGAIFGLACGKGIILWSCRHVKKKLNSTTRFNCTVNVIKILETTRELAGVLGFWPSVRGDFRAQLMEIL